MKKALAILSALALVASVATAETKIGAWGRGLFVPVSADDTTTNLGTSWAGSPRIGFTASGSSDNVGFQVDMVAESTYNANAGAAAQNFVGFGDQQKIWIKPADGLTLAVGTAYEDTLRGNGTFGSFDWIRLSWTGEDFTFGRIASSKGLVASYTGIENLFVAARINSGSTPAGMLMGGQYAVGYTIADVGQIRAQFIGTNNEKGTGLGGYNYSSGTIQVAFKLTAVENLYVDLGVAGDVKTSGSSDVKWDLNPKIHAYANYKMDALTLHVLAAYDMISSTALNADTGWNSINTTTLALLKSSFELGVGADYALEDGVAIGADIRLKDLMNDGAIGGFVGISKGFSNGKIGIGFEAINKGGFAPGYASASDATKLSWAVPVKFEYWF